MAVLAIHFALAGDYVRAHRYSMLAAERAQERSSHADAARLYRRAIETGRACGSADRHALAQAWEQMGESLRCIGEPAAASRALTEARRLLRDDPIAHARLCDRHADVASRSAALTAAVRWLQRGFRVLENVEGDDATAWRARMRSRLGGVRNRQGRWAEAVATCREAIAEAESVGELSALAHALYSLDWALVESGHPEKATHSWRALELYEQLADPEHELIVLNNLGDVRLLRRPVGRRDRALSPGRRARRALRTHRPTSRSSTATSARSSPTRASSTRPRSTCSERAASGAGPARPNRSRSSTCCSGGWRCGAAIGTRAFR